MRFAASPDPNDLEDPTEELDELPPLDPEPDEAAQTADYTDLLREFDSDDDLDDKEARDLDIGIEVAGLPEGDLGDDEVPEVDIGSLVAQPDTEALGDGDEPDVSTFDPSWGLREFEESSSEDAEGIDEPVHHLVSESPSELGEADDDAMPESAEYWLDLDDDPVFTQPSSPWPAISALTVDAPAAAVLETESGLVVASTEVRPWGAESPPLRLPNAATGLAETARGLLVATAAGELLLIERDRSEPSRLTSWKQPADCRSDELVQLDIWGGGARSGMALARTSTGVLLVSEDGGAGWERVQTTGQVLALDAQATPAWLVRATGRMELISGWGSPQKTTPIEAGLSGLGRGRCQLSVSGPLVAVTEDRNGLFVSRDGGTSFARVPGCANATAILALCEDDSFLVAVTRATDDRARIIRVRSPDSPQELIASVDAQRDDEHDAVEIHALTYRASPRQLVVSGPFGVRVFSVTS